MDKGLKIKIGAGLAALAVIIGGGGTPAKIRPTTQLVRSVTQSKSTTLKNFTARLMSTAC